MQKQAIAVRLRRQGWTQERIAAVPGVSQPTVHYRLRDVIKIDNVDAASGNPPPAPPTESGLQTTFAGREGFRYVPTRVGRLVGLIWGHPATLRRAEASEILPPGSRRPEGLP